jgi:hypothetical protein
LTMGPRNPSENSFETLGKLSKFKSIYLSSYLFMH